jgi:hypothetical protein
MKRILLSPVNPVEKTGMPERRLKILHVIDSLGIGGMERVVIDVANGLDAAEV